MGAILPLVGMAIDLAVKVFGIYNSMPSSNEAMKAHLRDLSLRLVDTKKLVAEVEIKEV